MDEPFAERLRAAAGTKLDRLSGDKVLLAATAATLEDDAVVGALRRTLAAASERSERWGETSDGEVAAALGTAAAAFREAEDDLDADGEAPDGPTLLALGDPDGPLARAGACCVAAPPLVDGLALQGVSYFVNEADTAAADRCRAVRGTVRDGGESATETLAAVCDSGADREAVVDGAVGAVEATYDRYARTLDGMGLDPKPIC